MSLGSSVNPFNLKDLEEQDDRDLRRLEIQCELNNQGASDLIVDLFMSDISNKVFKENVLLAIAMLEGGNDQVQKTIYTRLINEKNSEKFCKTFHDRIEIAQREIKNMNSFMSSDISDVTKIKAAVVNQQQQIKQTSNNLEEFAAETPFFEEDYEAKKTSRRQSKTIEDMTNNSLNLANAPTNNTLPNNQNNLPEVMSKLLFDSMFIKFSNNITKFKY